MVVEWDGVGEGRGARGEGLFIYLFIYSFIHTLLQFFYFSLNVLFALAS